jgi:hypothetical protein
MGFLWVGNLFLCEYNHLCSIARKRGAIANEQGHVPDGVLQPPKMQSPEFRTAHGLDGLIPIHRGLNGAADAPEEPAAPAVAGSLRRSRT